MVAGRWGHLSIRPGHGRIKLMAVLLDAARFLMLCWRPAPALAAENLFLRKQLAQYQERQVKPRRANDGMRLTMV